MFNLFIISATMLLITVMPILAETGVSLSKAPINVSSGKVSEIKSEILTNKAKSKQLTPKVKKEQSGDIKKEPGKSFTVPDIGIEMIWIKPGSFQMGSNSGDESVKPAHTVNISKGFWIGKYEVTQKQWKEVMGSNPSYFKKANLPVEKISWYDCLKFCKKLSLKTGLNFRLPSEAEWEYACRAGTTTKYYSGNSVSGLVEIAWCRKNSDNTSRPVGGKRPNAFGLYDMVGNVWEWCWDNWHDDYDGAPDDGSSWISKGNSSRVLRGGGWYGDDEQCSSSSRISFMSDYTYTTYGFRVVVQ